MKNAINYYYNLMPDYVHQSETKYYFEYNNSKYIFQECRRTIEEVYQLYNLSIYLYNKKIYLHQIILNNSNELVTRINDKIYILMKVINKNERKINISDLNAFYKFTVPTFELIDKSNWHDLWIKKIDYVEYQIDENRKKYTCIINSIDFFIGITENAIQLLHEKINSNLYVSHIRIKLNMQVEELYNPLNIIIDSKARDIGEYIKNTIYDIDNIEEYFYNIEREFKLSNNELKLLFIRIIFPSNYFDLCENTLRNESNSNSFDVMNNKIIYYEKKIREIYNYLYEIKILPEIEWLKKL